MNPSNKEKQQMRSKSSLSQKSQKKDKSNQKPWLSSSKMSNNSKNVNGHYTKFSLKMFKGNTYLPKFIKEVHDDPFSFECLKCKDDEQQNKVILANNLFNHLGSVGHQANTPSKEMDMLDTALKILEPATNKKAEKNIEEKKTKNESEGYLEFIGFLMSQNFSYAQIERLGKYLQKGAKEKRLGFLKTANFDQRFISKLSQDCFGKVINDNLIDKLSTVPFSLILDNSTFCGESICALKVKFLSKDWEEDSEAEITSIKNKIIGISNLKESSSGLTLLEIVESKLLKNEKCLEKLSWICT